MDKFIVTGGKKLKGTVSVSGAKNVALKALVAACLTEEEVIIHNIPKISDFFVMIELIKELGGEVELRDHTVKIRMKKFKKHEIFLEKGAQIRTSSMLMIPLLAREGKAVVPNPGGCRIGARPIDRTIKGLKKMGVDITYNRKDGYFHAKLEKTLQGMTYKFDKNTHTGTETLILAGVLAEGRTILENAAEEPEIDQLILLLNKMGARVSRVGPRRIIIDGVKKLHGTEFTIGLDRNEVVTFAICALMTEGSIFVNGALKEELIEFLTVFSMAGGGFEEEKEGIRFYWKGDLKAASITTSPYPGFMTDWQGPWTVLMTKAKGTSIVHEAVYENRFTYVTELKKMGANIELFNPRINNPENFYNFNLLDDNKKNFHAAKVFGQTPLHNAIVNISDLRAGATLVIGALAAKGQSIIYGVEHLDRGYESFEERLESLGANIKRIKE